MQSDQDRREGSSSYATALRISIPITVAIVAYFMPMKFGNIIVGFWIIQELFWRGPIRTTVIGPPVVDVSKKWMFWLMFVAGILAIGDGIEALIRNWEN